MAVRRCTYDCFGTDIATSARPVFDNEWLAELLRQPLSHHARERVLRAAGGEGDKKAHRPRRIGLRPCNSRHSRERGSARNQMQKLSTGKFHRNPPKRRRAVCAWTLRALNGRSGYESLSECSHFPL